MNQNTTKTIKNWALAERPREKMMAKGREALTDAELLAILIGSGNSDETAVDLSRRILKDAGDNLIKLSQLSIGDLTNYKGIGQAKAVTVAAALELGRRRRYAEAAQQTRIRNSRDAFEYFYMHTQNLDHEQFWILLLNPVNKVIKLAKIGDGGLHSIEADPKRIFKIALENNASALMLCHNHPSGSVEPSNADLTLTRNLVKGGEILDIKILDHIVVGINNYFSFADSGLI